MKVNSGFTLLEMIIVIILSSILVGLSSHVIFNSYNSYFTGKNYSNLVAKGNNALLRISKDLENAASFNAISSTALDFNRVDGVRVRYAISGTTISRSIDGSTPSLTLVTQATSFTIYYYNSTLAATATITAVRGVTVTFTLNDGTTSLSLIDTVCPRNL